MPTAAASRVNVTAVRWQLFAATLSLFAVRLILSAFRTGPLLVADETGYLTNARVLAGGVSGQMIGAPFYHGGYSLLVAPLVASGASPRHVYAAILALNALLASSLVPLLYLLLTRVFDTAPHVAVPAAAIGAAYPAVTLLSQVGMSENLLFPLVVVWLLCGAAVAEARTPRAGAVRAAVAGLVGGALYAVHGRMIVCVAVCAAYFVVLAVRRMLEPTGAVLGLAALGLVTAAAHRLDAFLVTHNYGGRAPDEAGRRLSGLTSLDSTASALRNLVGQSWYIFVATLGLPILAFALVGRRGVVGAPLRRQATLALLSALTAGLLIVSALSFTAVERSDMFVYGRYVEVVVPPLLAIAAPAVLGSVLTRRAVTLTIGVLCAATALVVTLRLTFHPQRGANRWDVSGLPAPPFQLDARALALVGAVAVFWLVVAAAAAARFRGAVLAVVAASFLLTTANVVRNPLHHGERVVYGSGWTDPAGSLPRAGAASVGYDLDAYDIFGLYAYQWFFRTARFAPFAGDRALPRARYFISSKDWPEHHRSLHVRRIWSDPNRDQAVFRVLAR